MVCLMPFPHVDWPKYKVKLTVKKIIFAMIGMNAQNAGFAYAALSANEKLFSFVRENNCSALLLVCNVNCIATNNAASFLVKGRAG